MGDYTRLTFWTRVAPETEAADVLVRAWKIADVGPGRPTTWPEHPLFATRHWPMLLQGASSYHDTGGSKLVHETIGAGYWQLNIDTSFKNYDDEVAKFLDWLSPFDIGYDQFRGFYQFEYDKHPTLIYRSNGEYLTISTDLFSPPTAVTRIPKSK